MAFAQPRRSLPVVARSSARISSLESHKTLDDTLRKQRKLKQLDGLEQDNAHDDPHANIIWNKAAPKFEDEPISKKSRKDDKIGGGEKSRRRRFNRPEFNKQRFKKSFAVHVAEHSKVIAESADPDFRRVGAFDRALAPPSNKPQRRFCAVCGHFSKYCCTKCGARYCSLHCRDIHNDTRCMKWMA
ncbi:unnamed protein product [Caenorhabditis bovis]|uniref:HIT-type domain-containing protein n=1 Tax=Caenorhabditis bovis TaxID=2654633 RepID=A0A8S1EM72_9PELO|nr:unnamed protein product [Caenorhabditis bovis]